MATRFGNQEKFGNESPHRSARELAHELVHGPLATRVPPSELQKLDRMATAVAVDAGTMVMRRGAVSRRCLLVIDGSFRVERDENLVTTLGPGDCVGDVAMLSRRPSDSDVVADSRSWVHAMTNAEFGAVLETCPSLRWHVLTSAIRRMAEAA